MISLKTWLEKQADRQQEFDERYKSLQQFKRVGQSYRGAGFGQPALPKQILANLRSPKYGLHDIGRVILLQRIRVSRNLGLVIVAIPPIRGPQTASLTIGLLIE